MESPNSEAREDFQAHLVQPPEEETRGGSWKLGWPSRAWNPFSSTTTDGLELNKHKDTGLSNNRNVQTPGAQPAALEWEIMGSLLEHTAEPGLLSGSQPQARACSHAPTREGPPDPGADPGCNEAKWGGAAAWWGCDPVV